jgi:hypothetical protein
LKYGLYSQRGEFGSLLPYSDSHAMTLMCCILLFGRVSSRDCRMATRDSSYKRERVGWLCLIKENGRFIYHRAEPPIAGGVR